MDISVDFGFIEVCRCFLSMNKNEMSSFKSIERQTLSSVHKASFLIFLILYAESMQRLWDNVFNFSPWDFLEVIIF